jgi:hypothetical protein
MKERKRSSEGRSRVWPGPLLGVRCRRLLCIAAVTASGCGGEEDGEPSGEARACVDTAAAVAAAARRCGHDYQANYDSFVATAAGGNCQNIREVRDEAALRSTCIPSFETISCDDLIAGALDPTCREQLLRKANLAALDLPQPNPVGAKISGTWEAE